MSAIGRLFSSFGRRRIATGTGSSPSASSGTRLLGESEQDKARREILLAEWKEVRESLRYFGNKRFAQMTVFIAANALLFHAVYTGLGRLARIEAGLVGLGLAGLFLVLEYGSSRFWKRFADRGRRIEQQLVHLELIRYYRPASDVATWDAYGFYVLTAIGWAYVGWWPKR